MGICMDGTGLGALFGRYYGGEDMSCGSDWFMRF